jgi:hypothetical protein
MIKSSSVVEHINSCLGDYSWSWNYSPIPIMFLTSKISKELQNNIYDNLFLDIYNELNDFYDEIEYPSNSLILISKK